MKAGIYTYSDAMMTGMIELLGSDQQKRAIKIGRVRVP